MKITDDVLNGGYDLMDLKTKLQEINDQLKNFSDYESENEEGTNLYDPNAIGIIVYDTPYERTEEIESKGLDTKLTNAREALLEYINPLKINFVFNYIEQTGNCDESAWEKLNVKFENDGTLSGKLIKEGKVLDSEFFDRLSFYYDSYRELELKSGRIVGIYKNNGEENLLDAPENLIGFAYVSNLDFSEPSKMYTFLSDVIVNGVTSSVVKAIKIRLEESGDEFENAVSILKDLYDGSDLTDKQVSLKRDFLDKSIKNLYGSENLLGLTDNEMIAIKVLKLASNYLAESALVPNPAMIVSLSVACLLDSLCRFFQTTASSDNGLMELSRYGSIESLSEIFQGQSYKNEFEVKDNSNFSNVFGDNLSENIIIGDHKDNILQALAGDGNYIEGGVGDDTLIGAKKEDVLAGGYDNDTYIYKFGYGQDIIREGRANEQTDRYGIDKLVLSGINYEDAELYRSENNLIIDIISDNDGGKITVENYFKNSGAKEKSTIENIKFEDRELMNILSFFYNDSSNNDDIEKSFTAQVQKGTQMYGNGGDDKIYGGSGSDIIYGDDYYGNDIGNDTLYGLGGNDTLVGGMGNDTLIGGRGNDTYIYKRGDGKDIIIDDNSSENHLKIDADREDIKFGINGNDLVIKSIYSFVTDNVDITIKNFYRSKNQNGEYQYNFEKISFNDEQNINLKYIAGRPEMMIFSKNFGKIIVDKSEIEDVLGTSGKGSIYFENYNESDAFVSYSSSDIIIDFFEDGTFTGDRLTIKNGVSENDFLNIGFLESIIYENTVDFTLFGKREDGVSEIPVNDYTTSNPIEESYESEHDTEIVEVDNGGQDGSENQGDNPSPEDPIEIVVGGSASVVILSEEKLIGEEITGRVLNGIEMFGIRNLTEKLGVSIEWEEGETDDFDRVIFEYKNISYEIYPRSGSIIADGENILSNSDSLIFENSTMISKDAIQTIFNFDRVYRNEKIFLIDNGQNASRYEVLYSQDLRYLDKALDSFLEAEANENGAAYVNKYFTLGGAMIISQDENIIAQIEMEDIISLTNGSSIGSSGFKFEDIKTVFGSKIVVEIENKSEIDFYFDEKFIQVIKENEEWKVYVNNIHRNYFSNPTMENGNFYLSYDMFCDVFDMKKFRTDYKNDIETIYIIDEQRGSLPDNRILGNEFSVDSSGNYTITYIESNEIEDDVFSMTSWEPYVNLFETVDECIIMESSGVQHGTENSDSIKGTEGNDKIYGEDGPDELIGNRGADIIYGGSGDDVLYGDELLDKKDDGDEEIDKDILYGEDGDDVLIGSAANDKLYGGSGNDVLIGGVYDYDTGLHNVKNFDEYTGDDYFEGGAGEDYYVIEGGKGHDIINNYTDDDGTVDQVYFSRLSNKNDVEWIIADNKRDLIIKEKYDGESNPPIDSSVTIKEFFPNLAARPEYFIFENDQKVYSRIDIFDFLDINFEITGSGIIKGNDIFDMEDKITGSNYDDTIYGYSGNDEISSGGGDDIIYGGEGTDEIKGEIGNDIIYGNEGIDEIYGDKGDDKLYGGDGYDKIYGGLGNDEIYGETGNDAINGGDGNDYIDGGSGNDTLKGQDGDDTILGGDGDDRIFGLDDDDVILGNSGDDTILGGKGIDKIYGGEGDDYIRGESEDDFIYGDSGDDKIYGESGNDLIAGNAGNDRLNGGSGDDYIIGGTGNDNIKGGDGDDIIEGTSGQNNIYGQDGNDKIIGGNENDDIFSGEGNDIVNAGDGDDYIFDSYGNDIINAEAGNDYIIDGEGNDIITGGSGNDIFEFRRGMGINTIKAESEKYPLDSDRIIFKDMNYDEFEIFYNEKTDEMIFSNFENGDQLSIESFTSENNKIDYYEFSNGEIYSAKYFNDIIDELHKIGNDEDNVFSAESSSSKVILEGKGGNDILTGSIYDDILIGGSEEDILIGGTGNDTYKFSKGFGVDVVEDNGLSTDMNKIQFIDITKNEVFFSRDSEDSNTLLIRVKGTEDKIYIKNYFSTNSNVIGSIEFSSGEIYVKEILELEFQSMEQIVSEYNSNLTGTEFVLADLRLFGDGENTATLNGNSGNDYLNLMNSNGEILAGAGDDVLIGGLGTATLNGEDGNDKLYSGSGSEKLSGGEESDIYYFDKGFGVDIIEDNGLSTDMNKIQFSDISKDEVFFSRDNKNPNTLVMRIVGTEDKIYVKDYFSTDTNIIGSIEFSSGETYDKTLLESEFAKLQQTVTLDNSNLSGTEILLSDLRLFGDGENRATLNGNSGNDYLNLMNSDGEILAGAGNDTLVGGTGTAILHGEDGDDKLYSGSGNEELIGGNGIDTYYFNRGFGKDTIVIGDYEFIQGYRNPETDKEFLVFNDIASDEIEFKVDQDNPSNLLVKVKDSEDQLKILNYFNNYDSYIDGMSFSDGVSWETYFILNKVRESLEIIGTENDDVIIGANDVGWQFQDTINGMAGNDTIYGNAGNDHIYGGLGDDILDGGEGYDYIEGGEGNNIYQFGENFGSDAIVISESSKNEIIELKNANETEINLEKVDNDLCIYVQSNSRLTRAGVSYNEIRIINAFDDEENLKIANIKFANNSVWDKQSIEDNLMNYINGTDFDDNIEGSKYADYIYGGVGNDYLSGNFRDDTYIFSKGFGVDTIEDNGLSTDMNKIQFSDISKDEVFFSRDNENSDTLVMRIVGTEDKIYVKDYFSTDTNVIGSIEFSSGETYDKALLESEFAKLQQTVTLDNSNLSGTEILLSDLHLFGDGENRATLNGNIGNDYLNLMNSDGEILAGSGDDILVGGTGTAILHGEDGDDKLYSGSGNEELIGGNGIDTYYFNRGFGKDTIIIGDYEFIQGYRNPETDKEFLVFNDIASDEIEFKVDQDDPSNLLVKVKDSEDELKVLNYFNNYDSYIDGMSFSDGVSWETYFILNKVRESLEIIGTENDDVINGANSTTEQFMDNINGMEGNDTIYGNAGNDYIYGGLGDDILDGGEGYDYIEGGEGNNIYQFGENFGSDAIIISESSKNEIIELKNANETEINLEKVDNDLCIYVQSNSRLTRAGVSYNEIRIINAFDDEENLKIANIKFANNSVWDKQSIEDNLMNYINGTDFDDNIEGSKYADEIYGYDGSDKIYGNSRNDYINGNNGDDIIYGGNGEDYLLGGYDNDKLFGDDGNDTLIGNEGDDELTGGIGDDTYIFSGEFGKDTIKNDGQYLENESDKVIFRSDLAENMDFSYNAIEDSLSLIPERMARTRAGFVPRNIVNIEKFSGENSSIDKFVFMDGESKNREELFDFDGSFYKLGTENDDTLSLEGNYQDGLIEGLNGNDTLSGSYNNDRLIGGEGNDVYKFSKGFGVDIIEDNGLSTDMNKIQFTDISKDEVFFSRDNENPNTLVMRIVGTEDKIYVKDYFSTDTNIIGSIEFSSGETYDKALLESEFAKLQQTVTLDNSNLSGTEILLSDLHLFGDGENRATLNGNSGNDYLNLMNSDGEILAGSGDDTLVGGAGTAILHGEDGDDKLYSGSGNEELIGGNGIDAYYFNRGFGKDTIIIGDYEFIQGYRNPETDKEFLVFNDISSDEVKFKVDQDDPNNLVIKINDSEDELKVLNYFNSYNVYFDKITFADNLGFDRYSIAEKMREDLNVVGTEFDDVIIGANDVGWQFQDTINGMAGNDTIYGNAGNDYIYGGLGDDILDGGEGYDYIEGGEGNNIYQFGENFGADEVVISDSSKNEIIELKNTNETDINLEKVDNDLFIHAQSNSELTRSGVSYNEIRVANAFDDEDNLKIANIKFADGIIWSRDDIEGVLINRIRGTYHDDIIEGTDYNDDISGYSGSDEIYGMSGNDYLSGNNGDDKLYGGESDDLLSGGEGNDELLGGSGNDQLYGEIGDDTYIFSKGFGTDVIRDYGLSTDMNNIKFTDISKNEVFFSRDSEDLNTLLIRISGTEDRIYVKDYFSTDSSVIGSIEFSSGEVYNKALLESEFEKLQQIVTSNNPNLTGTEILLSDLRLFGDGENIANLYGNSGNDYLDLMDSNGEILAGSGDDILIGGEGTSTLSGEAGNDKLYSGSGDEMLSGGSGDDTYIFSGQFGLDKIYDTGSSIKDLIEMDSSFDELIYQKSGNNLVIEKSESDKITINNYFYGNNYKVEEVHTDDNKFISSANIELLIQAMSEYCSTNGLTWTSQLIDENDEAKDIIAQYYSNTDIA